MVDPELPPVNIDSKGPPTKKEIRDPRKFATQLKREEEFPDKEIEGWKLDEEELQVILRFQAAHNPGSGERHDCQLFSHHSIPP